MSSCERSHFIAWPSSGHLSASILEGHALVAAKRPYLTLRSRHSFPATGPPDPGRVSEGSLKGSLKGFRRVLEGVLS